MMKISPVVIFLSLLSVLAGCTTGEKALFSFNAGNAKTGPYLVSDLNRDWEKPSWENGVSQGLVSIVDEGTPEHAKALRVFYPKGSYSDSSIPGKIQWILKFRKAYDELYFAYDVKFDRDFDFVKSGKLPGFVGGKHNSGGDKPNGRDGWSSRVVWLRGGEMGQYIYHPDQPDKWGQVFKYTTEGRNVVIERGRWHRIVNRIVMNTPTKQDGIVQAWMDGKLVLDIRNLRFRDIDSIGIDSFYFTTFFGGDDVTWAASKDEYTYFDKFLISASPIVR
jgi:hypothetical protein